MLQLVLNTGLLPRCLQLGQVPAEGAKRPVLSNNPESRVSGKIPPVGIPHGVIQHHTGGAKCFLVTALEASGKLPSASSNLTPKDSTSAVSSWGSLSLRCSWWAQHRTSLYLATLQPSSHPMHSTHHFLASPLASLL